MKTRHTRLFASVSAAALIGITALTPTAMAEDGGEGGTNTTTHSNSPWEMNWYLNQVNDFVNSLPGVAFEGPITDRSDLLDEINRLTNSGNAEQQAASQLLRLFANFIELDKHVPPRNAVYDENGRLLDRYEFYYDESEETPSNVRDRYGWVDGEAPVLDDDGEVVGDRYTAADDGDYYLDAENNDYPVDHAGNPVTLSEGEDGQVTTERVDVNAQVFDREANEWVDASDVEQNLQQFISPNGKPLFVDSLNNGTIVGEDGCPVNKAEGWLNPDDGYVAPGKNDGDDGSTGGDENDSGVDGGDNGSGVDDETTPDPEQEVVSELPDPAEGSEWEPVDDNEDRVTDGTDFYERVEDDEGNESWVRVDENGNPLDENGDPLDETGNDETGNDETTDNPLDGLNVTVDGDRIQVSFPVDLAGNPHTLTASLDAKNGFTVAFTPGNESSTGNGSSNGSSVISDPEVTPVYIDANGNTYPARYDEDGNIVPPKNLADGTYRLGFEIQGEDGDPVIVGTDYNVKVGDGAMTEAKNDEGGGVVNVDNETDKDKDDDKDKGKNGGRSNNSSSANFKPAVSNLKSLGAGGGTDVGGGGTDSDATSMQNSGDNSSNRTSRNASNDSNAANAASPASYDNGVQTHASGQENLAETGTNTNTLLVMVGGLLMAAAGVLLVGRRKGWV